MRYRIIVEGRTFDIEVKHDGQVWVNNQPYNVDMEGIDGLPLFSLLVDNRSYEAHVEMEENGESQVAVAGRSYRASLQGKQERSPVKARRRPSGGPAEITAPLPGWLVEVRVAEGDLVQEGDVIAVLESMKMHLELRTPHAGVVRDIIINPGREVTQGEILAVIDETKEGEDREGENPPDR